MKKIYIATLKKCRFPIVLCCIFFSLSPNSILLAQTSVPFTTGGANTWFCPAGVTSVTVECWGGGGAGGGATANPAAGGGGAGGAYTKAVTVAVSPGTTYNLFVGAGGVGSNTAGPSGSSSWFNTNTTLLAVGGTGGGLAANGAGATAPTTGNIGGTTNFYGGNGVTGSSILRGGGGGGSAGTASSGNSGSGATGGTAVTGGGAGANGNTSGNGTDAITVGGGGGGARTTSAADKSGGDGFTGKILISYTTPGTYKSLFTGMSIGSTAWCAGETRTVTVTVKNNGTAAWVDAARQDINIGVKWDADADYLIRTDVLGLPTGTPGTYSFLVTAPATPGTNHLTFDVVYEAVSWFGNNGGGVGPGNLISQSTALTINASPTAVGISGGGAFCGSTTITAMGGTGGTMYYQGTTSGGTSTITPASSAIITTSGTYYFRARAASGCWGTEGSAAVTINPLPATVIVSGGGTFCSNPTITAVNGSDGTIYFQGTTSGGTSIASPSASQVITTSGNYYFRARSALGCWGTEGTAAVTINSLPTAVTVSGSGTFCAGTTINAAGGTGGTIYFQGTTLNGTSTATPAASAVITTSGIYYFRANNSCGWGTEGSVSVTINPLPTAVTAAGTGTFCSSTIITAANGGSGIIYYQGAISGGTSTVIASTSQSVSASGTYYFRAQSAAGCWGAQGSVVVSISQTPTTAVAGPDQTGTATCGLTTVTLAANAPGTGTGAWTIFSGTGGTITTPASRTSTFTGTSGNTYTLRWTISNSPCTPSTDDVVITFNSRPTATTTATPNTCFGGNIGTATVNPLGGLAPYTYLWSNGQTTQTAINLSAATYTVTITDNKGCTVPGTTSAIITQPTQVVADAGPDQNICSGSTTTLGGIPAATGGTGAYTYAWSPATGLSSSTIANPTATPASTTIYSLIVTDANGCNSAANTTNITIGSATKTWIGGGTSGSGPDNNFNNLRNWSPAGVPGSCNNVVMNFDVSSFCCGTTNTVSLSNNVTINSLSITMSGFVFVQSTSTQRLDVGVYSLSITGTTTMSTTAAALFAFGPFENEISVGIGGSVTYGGNLITTSSSSDDDNFPFYATTNNSGKFTVKANATLGGIDNDFGNKPAQVIFDGVTGVTQTITHNSGAQAILLGVTSTDIGQSNSPKVVLAGTGTGGFQSIGNLNVNNTSTLDAGAVQTINRRTAGGTLNLAGGAFMNLGASTGGQTGSNFPSNYSTINLNSTSTPTSTVEYYGAAAQTIFATPAYGNLIVSGVSTKTAGAALTIKGDATINTAGDIFAGNTFSHSIAGNWYNNVSTAAFTSTGLVAFNGSAPQTIGGTSGSIFNNLTISNLTGVSLAQDQSVNASLTLTLGNLNITNKNLTMGTASSAIAGTFSSSRMIIADGGGQVRKNYAANGSYVFPIGDNSVTPEYSPITLNYTSGTYAAGAYAGVKVTNAKHPANTSPVDYLNRYWGVSNSGITNPAYIVTATYLPADVAGTEGNISTGKYPGSSPWISYSPANMVSHFLLATAVTNTGSVDISGISKPPTVSISGGGVTICLSSSTGLTTTVTSASAVTYAWTGQGLSSSTTANPTVTPTSIGSQIYSVVVTDLNGLTATSGAVIIVSDPAVLVTSPVAAISCSGANVNFNVTVTGSGLTYQWQVSIDNGSSFSNISAAPYSGFNTNSLTIIAPSFGMSGYLYRVIIIPQSPCSIITTTPGARLLFKNLWIGTTSIDWNNGANWSDGNTPSLSCPDVTIPGGTLFQPTLNTGTATINNLNIQALGYLTLSNATLQIAGSITNTGTFDVTNGAMEFNGTSAQTIPANVFANNTIKNLIISNDVSLSGQDSLTGTLSFGASNKNLSTNGNLTLRSTISATASIDQIINGNGITGDVTVERYIATGPTGGLNHGKSWQLLATPTFGSQSIKESWQEGASTANVSSNAPGSAGNPVAGYGTMLTSNVAGATTTAGFDAATAPGPSIKTYNYLTDGYDGGPANTSLSIYTQKGYMILVRGDRSVYTSSGTATPTVLRTKGTLFTPLNPPHVTDVVAGKRESMGNPYASAIDMRSITRTGGVDEFFYVWDPRLGSGMNLGAFQTFLKFGTDYIASPGGGSYGPFGTVNNYIQSGQAFLVEATGSNGTVAFKESDKASGSALFSRPAAPEVQKFLQTGLYIVAANGSATIIDGVLNSFDDSYSNTIDGLDAKKSSNTGENLSVKTGGQLLAIERKHTIAQQDTIFLNLTGEKVQSYQFHFNAKNLNTGGLEGFLEDSYLHTRTPLNLGGNTVVNFSIVNTAGSYANDRFRIVLVPAAVLPVTFTSVTAYGQDKKINVEWVVENEMNMKQYEVEKSTNGTQFNAIAVKAAVANGEHSASYITADVSPVEGYNYYRIKSVDINGKTEYSNVVKVLTGSVKQDITIYPNPITDGTIHLQLMNQPEGKYSIRLLNKIGQVMLSQQIDHARGSSTELIKWDYNLAHGMYQLEVTRPDRTQTSISVMY